ncbi:MAG: GDYXXLXY domain-containing protein, partial [Pirellulales bacterium]
NDSWWNDRAVYVSLEAEADGKHYRAGAMSVDRPTSGRYIKGKFSRGWGGNDLRFGIEALYVEEGEGRRLEQLRNTGQLSAEIALTPWGQAKLCGVR